MAKIESFPPIIETDSRILILGSMPGVESLRKREYYGNPRNHFWQIIFALFREDIETNYSKKITFLKKNKIALWDVLSNSERKGSLDSNIKNEEVNDFRKLFKAYPDIVFIGFNGSKAFNSFKKYIGFNLLEEKQIAYKKLPSTSPIPFRNFKTFEDKLAEWKVIKDYLKE